MMADREVGYDAVQVRMLLLGRDCGALIGKGGQNFNKLRQHYNVNVQMPSSQTTDRVFSIDGNLENCVSVVKEVLSTCSQSIYPVAQNTEKEINLLIQTDSIGLILGKGGMKIKEIRETSNAKIKVYEECLPNSSERVIAIGGNNDEEVLSALKQILNILKDQPRVASPLYYDPSSMSNAAVDHNMSNRMQTGQKTWKDEQNGAGHMKLGGYNTDIGFGYSTDDRGNGEGFGFGNNVVQTSEFLQAPTETKLTMPNDICGAIIGKGGIRIREIRDTSGAKIAFSESNKEIKQDRVITITGTQKQVQIAEGLMTQAARNRNN